MMDVDELDTTVVCISDYSFNWLMEKKEYAFPGDPNERRLMKYMAFYRTKPTMAITHYAEIDEVIEKAEIPGKYRLFNFGDRIEDEATKVVFDEILELEEPVGLEEGGGKGKGIQSIYYTRLELLKKASTVTELRDMRKES